MSSTPQSITSQPTPTPSPCPTRLPWEERWNQPSRAALMAPVKEQHQVLLGRLLDEIGAFEGVTSKIVWHGSAWKWTIEFTLKIPGKADPDDPMAYFVANPDAPLLCVPMREDFIAQLPIKRLNRYIRDSIRSAKCAVHVHWAKWNPTAMTEVEHLLDLFKRKHKFLGGNAKAPK